MNQFQFKIYENPPSILMIAFLDCDCRESLCIDPCCTPVEGEGLSEYQEYVMLLHNYTYPMLACAAFET